MPGSSNPQSYSEATYVDRAGAFSQDVSALSHEMDGDPEEGFSNYGAFHYVLHGFTYNLQDLVTLPYFGAPTSTSVNGWLSFQGNPSLFVCSNGS